MFPVKIIFMTHNPIFIISWPRLRNRFALYFIILESLSHKNALFQDWSSGSRVEVKTMKSLQTTDKRWSVTFGSGELKINSCHTDLVITKLLYMYLYRSQNAKKISSNFISYDVYLTLKKIINQHSKYSFLFKLFHFLITRCSLQGHKHR